ncbi:MAG: type II toxin-antitoxin system Y4mF family antitoxin [Candidatus Dadabacteria bacterium]|nr:type II toxin-antitoxin system Y4mF family antitoxin [Candidatus Dadabacteria bacterium]
MNTAIKNAGDLGRVVRETRKAQKLSQNDLAGMAGTGRRFIVDLEKGKETAQLGKVLCVLATLGVSVAAIKKWD